MAIQPGWGSQWETLANAISNYYGGGVGYPQYEKVVQMLNSGQYTMEEMESILGNIPEFDRTYNANGELIKVAYRQSTNATTSTAGSVAQQVNSNVANSTKTEFSTVQTITKDQQTGKVAISDNLVKYKTGQLAPTTIKGIPISALQGVMATSAGITVGKNVSQVAYDKGFNWLAWAGVDMESLNPATWSSITQDYDGWGADAFNFILGLDDDNNPQPYMTQETLAYMIAYMGAVGVFDGGNESASSDEFDIPVLKDNSFYYTTAISPDLSGLVRIPYYRTGGTVGTFAMYVGANHYYDHMTCVLKNGDTYPQRVGLIALFTSTTPIEGALTYTYDNKTVYYFVASADGDDYNCIGYGVPTNSYSTITAFTNYADKLAWIIEYGTHTGGGVEGITDQAGATVFDGSGISDWSDIATVLAALMAQFPELWENRVEVSPDGDNVITYVPVGFPTGGTGQMPTTDGASQSELAPDITGDGDNSTDELIKTLIEFITNTSPDGGMESNTNTPVPPVDPNGDPRGTGENPPIVPPVGSASALWKIYNPSQSQLDTFGAWLWSSNFVDQLLKLFNDPMQAIIGLHKVYCTPPTSGSGPIKVGYLVSDASANYVSNQYTEIDCGSVDMKEHFNNAFDYDEFTRVSIFLPFIGFKDLDVKDIMRGAINVKYGVDVLTGACLAKITVTRDLNSPILYTFAGNCAVQYPVSSGSYIGIITGLCSLIGGVAGSLATGGALAPALVGATAGLPRMHTTVEHSGSISANSGALGPKKPYIVIQRPQTHMPLNGVAIEGEGQNESVVLGTLTGYVKVKKADLMGIPATGSELDEIRDLLEAGIYMY